MYLRKYKISKAAFLENTSQQLPLYIIWFRVLPNQKYYFMSETYLKSSQTSKMKLLAKVVNASRGVFRRVEPLKMELFTKIINGWKPPSEIFCWVLKLPLDSVFNYFRQKLYLRSLKELICLCIWSAILEMNKWK